MLMTSAVRMNRWMSANGRLFSVIGWISFAVICADYAKFIDLPTIVTVPFWLGFIANVLRWTVWEGVVRPRVGAASSRKSS